MFAQDSFCFYLLFLLQMRFGVNNVCYLYVHCVRILLMDQTDFEIAPPCHWIKENLTALHEIDFFLTHRVYGLVEWSIVMKNKKR